VGGVTSRERSLVDAALDCLGVGDQDGAVGLLLELRDGPAVLPPRCPVCGARAWPEDLARHVFSAHAAVAS
jgi:hypothetical protein